MYNIIFIMYIIFLQSDEDLLSTELINPRTKLPPLLMKLNERPPETLEYLGVSYGLTQPLLKLDY